ncbi:UNVERIFIED_CONTAM: Pectinesterase QRT1 [Sesamum calycinum]|uniref:Pectinesterase QRT1 n=1 Tax=Sesamum calycinum TaxID=2727403 RepID=A0AAW2MDI2_9LAMI
MNILGGLSVVIVVVWTGSEVGFGQYCDGNYITWDDLKVDSLSNGVIVVDKSGGGDSDTVQGAVDMVPENNAQRVKIHILPGVYSTVVLGEYECRGKGADRGGRVGWSKGLSFEEAKPYLDSTFISGDLWLKL